MKADLQDLLRFAQRLSWIRNFDYNFFQAWLESRHVLT